MDAPGKEHFGDILHRFPMMNTAGKSMIPLSGLPPLMPIKDVPSQPVISSSRKSHDWAKFSIANILSSNSSLKNKSGKKNNDVKTMKVEDNREGFNNLKAVGCGETIRNVERNLPSYTSMIGQAILHSRDKKLTLGEIYDFIEQQFPGIEDRVKGWRNCVRHNLSLHECFMKLGPSIHGRGNDWTVHPTYVESFLRGHFRKRIVSKRRNHSLLNLRPWLYNSINNTSPPHVADMMSMNVRATGQSFKFAHSPRRCQHDSRNEPRTTDFCPVFKSFSSEFVFNSPHSLKMNNREGEHLIHPLRSNEITEKEAGVIPEKVSREMVNLSNSPSRKNDLVQPSVSELQGIKKEDQQLGPSCISQRMHGADVRLGKRFKIDEEIPTFSQKHTHVPHHGPSIGHQPHINSVYNLGPRPKSFVPSMFSREPANILHIPANLGQLCHLQQTRCPNSTTWHE